MADDRRARYEPAARRALAAFGCRPAELTVLPVSENVTFRVTDADDGRDYVLRLHRPGYRTLEELESERAWTTALERAGIRVPHGRPTPDGRHFVPVAIASDGEQRFAGMLEWIPGELLPLRYAGREHGTELRGAIRSLGGTMARMHEVSAHWVAPAGFRRGHLDADALLGEAPHWGRFWDCPRWSADERELMTATRRALWTEIAALDHDPRRYGLIHADLHPENLLAAESGVTAIDFDDAAFGWYAFDLATTLQSLADHEDYPALHVALLDGYADVRTLEAADLALIDHFQLVRALSIVGWYMERPEAAAADAAALAALRLQLVRDCGRYLDALPRNSH